MFKKKKRIEKSLNFRKENEKFIKFAAVPLGVGFADKKRRRPE